MLSLENDLTVRAKTTEINVKDFTSGSYATIIGNEVNISDDGTQLYLYPLKRSNNDSELFYPSCCRLDEE